MARVVLWVSGLLLLAALLTAPDWTADQPYLLHMLVLMCIYAIPAVGLNLMLGYCGLVSLGHMGFAGLGAYTAAVLIFLWVTAASVSSAKMQTMASFAQFAVRAMACSSKIFDF